MRYPYRLRKENLQKAAEYIYDNGRDIDVAVYEYHFLKRSAATLFNVLHKYVNSDGGFGKGLEFDYSYGGSTPLSTTLGLQIVYSLGVYTNTDLTFNALEYFTYSMNLNRSWACITEDVNYLPHAKWWEFNPSMKNTYSLNPTAEIIAYFYHYGGGHYRNFVHTMLDDCYSYLMNPNNGNDMHELICLMRLVRILPDNLANKFKRFLRPRINNNLCYDSNKYSEYVFNPLSIFESPSDPLSDLFRNSIEDNLDYLIESQRSDGAWRINYHWDRDEHAFDRLIPQIQANITLKNIVLLKRFNRF